MLHTGSCHCGAITIEVEAGAHLTAYECNCSMCERTGFLHLIVAASSFQLITGHDALTTYTFNTGVAQHYFCRRCGCKPFYVPRSNPDGFSVNVRCLDRTNIQSTTVLPFDGKDWDAHAGKLSHLSR